MMQKSTTYFNPWSLVHEGNPQEILERKEAVTLPPMLIMQGELDTNVPWQISEKMGQMYRAAGGECEVEIFKGCEHQWINDPGPQTTRAHEVLKAFIARQLTALRKAA
jgi:alpha-beta hydrolase superfamily lysophospholipase